MSMKIMPNYTLVRLLHEDYDDIFLGKPIVKDNGETVRLTIATDVKADFDRKSQLFRRTGEVVQVGKRVDNILPGDIAILDYKVDNDQSAVVGEDKKGKLVAVWSNTLYENEDKIAYANRKTQRDVIVSKKGDINRITDIIGVIRGSKFLARDPYVILKYDPFALKHNSSQIIHYEEKKKTAELEVIAVSEESRRKYGIIEGAQVLVNERDLFRIELKDDVILCCNDSDVKFVSIGISGKSKEDVFKEILK